MSKKPKAASDSITRHAANAAIDPEHYRDLWAWRQNLPAGSVPREQLDDEIARFEGELGKLLEQAEDVTQRREASARELKAIEQQRRELAHESRVTSEAINTLRDIIARLTLRRDTLGAAEPAIAQPNAHDQQAGQAHDQHPDQQPDGQHDDHNSDGGPSLLADAIRNAD